MSEDLVNDICLREFTESPSTIKRIEGGLNSRTVQIEVENNSFIIQITENSEPHELENCINCFEFLKISEIPVPKVVSSLKEIENSHYTIVEFVDGDNLGEDFTEKQTLNSGKMLAKIHNFQSFEKAGWISWENGEPEAEGFPEGSLRSRIEQLMIERLEFFEELDIEELAEVTEKFLQNHVEKVPKEFNPVFVHHDFNPGNILSEDEEITAILDFDYSHSSHAQRDLAKASNKFWLRGGDRETLYRGYRKLREIDDSFEQHKLIYQLESLID